jgi:hypothetical protein
MAKATGTIKFEIEPWVKLTCLNFGCVHNLSSNVIEPEAACNLKQISIDRDGKCANMVLKADKDKKPHVFEG